MITSAGTVASLSNHTRSARSGIAPAVYSPTSPANDTDNPFVGDGGAQGGMSTPSRTPKGRGFDSSLGYLFAANDYLHGFSTEGCSNTTHDFAPGTVNNTKPPEVDRRCTSRSITARHITHYTDLWESGTESEGPATGLNGTAFEEALFSSRATAIIESHDSATPIFL